MLAIVLALKLPTILILAWAFCRPEEMFRPGRRYWGVLVEQQFAGPKMLASGAVVQALGFGLYIFPVYGMYLAAPRLLFFEEFSRSTRTSRWQGVWLFLGIAVLPLATWLLWSALLQTFGFDRTGVP